MPHIIVEHTQDIDNVAEIVGDLHNSLAGQETITLDAIKSRSVAVQNAVVGQVQGGSMVHIALKLLSGRSDALRTKMTADLLAVVRNKVADSVSVTVESIELHNPSYQK